MRRIVEEPFRRGVLSGSFPCKEFFRGIADFRGLVELFFSGFSIERWNDIPARYRSPR